MNFLSAGFPVVIVETADAALQRGVGIMRGNYENTAKKGRLTQQDVERNMGLLTPSLALQDLADCDLVIEAVFENMAIKREIFAKLDAIVKPGAILASNTSYLDIDEIASVTKRPGDVVGMHFFSPANVMRLLEVVRGEKTAPDVLATVMALAKKIGKVAAVAGVCHGFIGNRMLEQRQVAANQLILEGAMPWDVDRVLYDFGFPMGRSRWRTWPGWISAGRRKPRRAKRCATNCAKWIGAGKKPAPGSTITMRNGNARPRRS
ncbi:MAG: 3-hydroxyacyl-CoA dehydrogenase family protein [Rhodospirillales bacterium]